MYCNLKNGSFRKRVCDIIFPISLLQIILYVFVLGLLSFTIFYWVRIISQNLWDELSMRIIIMVLTIGAVVSFVLARILHNQLRILGRLNKQEKIEIKKEIIVRPIRKEEYLLLEEFLYHAIFIPEGEEMPAKNIIYDPEIYKYIKNFGIKNDYGMIAEVGGKVVSIAWTRVIGAYGFIDSATPELAISTLPQYRGQGIGEKVMNKLFEELIKRGYKRTSLSVQKNNPAVRFYKRLGYKITHEKLDHVGNEDYLMIKELI